MTLSRAFPFWPLGLLCCLLIACSPGSSGGKYYDRDGPPGGGGEARAQRVKAEVVIRQEPPHRGANRPYKVMRQSFHPMTGDRPFTQVGVASWYGKQFHGKKTAIGETYDMYKMTAAHPTMELPSYAKVTNLANGRSVIVRVNDRGPFLGGRAIDMSYAAAVKLGYQKQGTTRVKIERITRRQIAAGKIPRATHTSTQFAPATGQEEPVQVAAARPRAPAPVSAPARSAAPRPAPARATAPAPRSSPPEIERVHLGTAAAPAEAPAVVASAPPALAPSEPSPASLGTEPSPAELVAEPAPIPPAEPSPAELVVAPEPASPAEPSPADLTAAPEPTAAAEPSPADLTTTPVPDAAPPPPETAQVATEPVPMIAEGEVTAAPEGVPGPVPPGGPAPSDPQFPSAAPAWGAQIGAYTLEVTAREMAAHSQVMLHLADRPEEVRVVLADGLWHVLVGAVPSREEAQGVVRAIAPLLGINAFAVYR